VRWAPGATQGEIVAGGHGEGSGLHQLNCPHGIAVDSEGALIVVDGGNARVVRWAPGATQGEIVAGGHGEGSGLHQLECPWHVMLEVMVPWTPTLPLAGPMESRALAKLMLMIDARRSSHGLVAIGSLLITHVLPWALPLQRLGSLMANRAQPCTCPPCETEEQLPVIEILEHADPPAIMDEETAAILVAQMEAGYIERSMGTDAGLSEPTLPSGAAREATAPASSGRRFSPLLLLNFTRHPPEFEAALSGSELLREVREGLDREGFGWQLPHGANLFIHPSELQAAMRSTVGLRLCASHVITSEALAPIVLAAVNGLPRRCSVQLKEMHVLAYTTGEMESTMIVRNTFLDENARFMHNQQVVQSTTVARRGGWNPRQYVDTMAA